MHTQPGDQMDYAHTNWRSHGIRTHTLEIRWIMYTAFRSDGLRTKAWRSDGLRTHSMEILTTMHTQPGDPIDYAQTDRKSDGLRTQPRDQMDCAQTAYRSDGLLTHSLGRRWTILTQPEDQMDYAHTAWGSNGL
jgi:hypothetical protein